MSSPARDDDSDHLAADGAESPSRRRHAVFITDFVHLGRPFEAVAPMLLDAGHDWRSVAARSAAHQRFEVLIGDPRQTGMAVIVPIRWEPVAFERLLPMLDADIELLDLGDGHCRLSMSGRYQVPLAQLGATLDRLAMHRLAEASVRRFLSEISETLAPA
ncbi:MAG: hypothetical protein ACLQNG_00155 [Acidimicrobiales bacterium]|jgi:hypothetical protein